MAEGAYGATSVATTSLDPFPAHEHVWTAELTA